MSMLKNVPATRRERNKADKLARIRDAAHALFREKGFDATTTREIAERADVGTGTLFLYFKEKRDVLFDVFRADLEAEVERAFASLPERDLGAQLRHVFGHVFDAYEAQPATGRAFVKEMMFLDGDAKDAMTRYSLDFLARLVALVESAKARGEVDRAVESFPVVMLVFGQYYLLLVSWLGGALPGTTERDYAMHAAIDLLARRIAPPEETRHG